MSEKPWGPNSPGYPNAPVDWDGGDVLLENGEIGDGNVWDHHDSRAPTRIISYRATSDREDAERIARGFTGDVSIAAIRNGIAHGRELESDRLAYRIGRLEDALTDLVSWFDVGPSSYGPWIIQAGPQGVDDAVAHARTVLGEGEVEA